MQNIQKIREMLAGIGRGCAQITLGCEGCQQVPFEVDVLIELEIALRELHENAAKLLESAKSSTIDPDAQCKEHGCARWRCDESHPAADHDGDTQPANERPEPQ